MQAHITLRATDMDGLNQQITEYLRKGYLIKGAVQQASDGQYAQLMVIPRNMDAALTPRGAIMALIFIPAYAALLYYIF